MSVFDYMNVVSEYIINKLENKKDMEDGFEINIKPMREAYTNNLYYEVTETKNYSEKLFYLRFPCASKEEYYSAVNSLLVQYLKNSDLVIYTATNGSKYTKNKFSIVSRNRASVSFEMEDENDMLVFNQFKTYLDEEHEVSLNNDNIVAEIEEEEKIMDEVKTYGKIML